MISSHTDLGMKNIATIVEYVHEMYEMHTINSDYIIIQAVAAIFLFNSVRNGLIFFFFFADSKIQQRRQNRYIV